MGWAVEHHVKLEPVGEDGLQLGVRPMLVGLPDERRTLARQRERARARDMASTDPDGVVGARIVQHPPEKGRDGAATGVGNHDVAHRRLDCRAATTQPEHHEPVGETIPREHHPIGQRLEVSRPP